jgi:hypothetical protein
MSEWKKARHLPTEIEYREPVPTSGVFLDIGMSTVPAEIIQTLEGNVYAIPGEDYVILGTADELYPIKKSIFKNTYEEIPC